ncbi:5' nucleotidase, NT5C type [Winogradskyella sp.]|uniref:5' nucleotidase, NT5C type n=1 Tax=Winogradskyella sp. TaxID=1883156 RepID=UPI003BA949F2
MTIFVDMDDVLACTYEKHIELYNKDYQQQLSLAEIVSGEVWQNVPEQHQKSIREHASQLGFFADLEPKKDSQQVMEVLCQKYNVYIATAATQFPNSLKEKSVWLDQYFPFITWQHRIMCGHKHILHGDLLIDDRSYNLKHFNGDTFLFDSPHNQHETNYTRVYSWLDIAERLL